MLPTHDDASEKGSSEWIKGYNFHAISVQFSFLLMFSFFEMAMIAIQFCPHSTACLNEPFITNFLSFCCLRFYLLRNLFFSLMFTAQAALQLPSVITTCWGLYYSILQMWHQKLLFQNNYMLLLELIPTSPNKDLLVDPWKVFSVSLILMPKYRNFKMSVVVISCAFPVSFYKLSVCDNPSYEWLHLESLWCTCFQVSY